MFSVSITAIAMTDWFMLSYTNKSLDIVVSIDNRYMM